VLFEDVFADYFQGGLNIPVKFPPVPPATRVLVASLAVVALAGCSVVDRFRGARTAFSGDSAYAYTARQVEFGPRVPGSTGARNAGDWIVAQMKQRADSVDVQTWTHQTAEGVAIPMRNILARFRPSESQRVLFITHWDTRPIADGDRNLGARHTPIPGANDGAAGVGLFVALADALKKTPPSVGVDLLFVDGEDYGEFGDWADSTQNKDVMIGSQYFARTMPPSYKPMYGVLFDMIGDFALQLPQEVNSINSAPEVVARVWDAAKDLGYGKYFIPEAGVGITDDHLPFIRAGLHVIDVVDINYCSDGAVSCDPPDERNLHHTLNDTMRYVSAKSLQIVGDVALTLVTK
jgi:glutaminyl-peptide cyclotransferase